MPNDSGYCRRQAAECAVRAREASDREIREFFVRMRGVWTAVADRFDGVDSATRPEPTRRESKRPR